MVMYARGGLSNTKGITLAPTAKEESSGLLTFKRGRIQQAPNAVTLGPTLFRCIAGLESSKVRKLQKGLLDKSIVF